MLCYYIKSVTEPKTSVARYSSDVLQSNNCQVTEAIQSLPPELREIIQKHYIAIKLRERVAFGLKEVHNELLKQPFCHNRQQLVRIIICLNYENCRWKGFVTPVISKESNINCYTLLRSRIYLYLRDALILTIGTVHITK